MSDIASTVGDVLLTARQRGGTAFVMPGLRWSYKDLFEHAVEAGRAMRAAGLRRGDVVALFMENSPEYMKLLLGAAMIGAVPALLGSRASTEHFASRLRDFKSKALFATTSTPEAAALVAIMAGEIPTYVLDEPSYADFLAAGAGHDLDPERECLASKRDDPLAIVFTSGMTGPPKTCWISHWNLLCKAAPFARRFEITDQSRLWSGVPMFQIGFLTPALAALAIGATVIAHDKADPSRVLELLIAEAVTHAYPIYLGNWLPIQYHLNFRPSAVSQLSHVCLIGPFNALQRIQRALPHCVVMNTYGSPEEAGAFCLPRSDDRNAIRLGSVGTPFSGHEVRIVDPKTRHRKKPGAVGEIQVRGEGVPKPRPKETFTPEFTDDDWLRTGDLGSLDGSGTLFYYGRLSEMLTIDGERVSALAIETVLLDHPQVAVAQVIGLPDPASGEIAAAYVELRPGAKVSTDELLMLCRERLPASQVPRHVVFLTEWPVSASKIYKPSLADLPLGPRLVT